MGRRTEGSGWQFILAKLVAPFGLSRAWQATSFKTLDLHAHTYQTRPSQIYGTLTRYLRDLGRYEGGSGLVASDEIRTKFLILAVPNGTPEQMSQIQRSADLARELGIDMIVEVIE